MKKAESLDSAFFLYAAAMADTSHYVIRGGPEGRERLRVLSRVMRPSTMALFDRLNINGPLTCLDAGCGGGDVTLDLARRVAPHGRVIGEDIDEEKLTIARAEASQQDVGNVEFRLHDERQDEALAEFDVVYARFLLTHLSDPAAVIDVLRRRLRPGGLFVVEDVDFSGYFTYPETESFSRYRELYYATVSRRGGDPDIGHRLPSLLQQAGLDDVDASVVQHVSMRGEAKLLNPLTMQNIASTVLADGLATPDEIDRLVDDLYAFAADPNTLAGTPRVVQSWGCSGKA
jgi:SAM-dependent methyltransferase